MWSILWRIFQVSGVLSLGATVERWFSPGQPDQPGQNSDGNFFSRFTLLLAVAAVVMLIYQLIFGKKISIR